MKIDFTISQEPGSWISYHPTAELEGDINISFQDGFVFRQTGVLIIELWKVITNWLKFPCIDLYKYDSMDFDETVFSFDKDGNMYLFSSENQEIANVTSVSEDELIAGFKDFQNNFYCFIKEKFNEDLNQVK
jgi:hypothetical protein